MILSKNTVFSVQLGFFNRFLQFYLATKEEKYIPMQ